jgi:2'-5' RNA ligase
MTLFYGSRLKDVAVEPLEWTVNEFALLRSDLGSGKPYEVLGRWALQNR